MKIHSMSHPQLIFLLDLLIKLEVVVLILHTRHCKVLRIGVAQSPVNKQVHNPL
jgi:hypothetical protein